MGILSEASLKKNEDIQKSKSLNTGVYLVYTQRRYTKSQSLTKMDLFDNTVLCKNCGKKMQPVNVDKDGFRMRALKCPACSNLILHPSDIEEHNKFKELRGRQFHVKLRMVGNSYTVSIPREIVNFLKESEEEMNKARQIHQKIHERMHVNMQQMVTMAFEEFGKLSLMFDESGNKKEENLIKKEPRKILKEGQ